MAAQVLTRALVLRPSRGWRSSSGALESTPWSCSAAATLALRAPRRATRRTRIISPGRRGSWGWWRPPRPGWPGRRLGRGSGPTCPDAGGCCGRAGRPRWPGAVGADETGQASAVGAGAFNADALHRPEAFGPGHQGNIAAGRGHKRFGVEQPSRLVDDRRHMGLQVGVDADGDRALRCWHAFHDRSVRAARTGTARTHRDGGQHCDGASRQAPIGSLRPTGGCLQRPPTAGRQIEGKAPAGETSGQTSHRGTTQIIAVRSSSTNSRPALRAADQDDTGRRHESEPSRRSSQRSNSSRLPTPS